MNEIVDASQSSTQELQEKNRRELAELQRQLRERALELDRSQGAARGLQEEVGLTPATVSTTHPSHHCTRLAPHASRPRTRLTTTAIVPSHSSHPHFRATITPVIIVSPSQPSPPHNRLTRLPLTPVSPSHPSHPSDLSPCHSDRVLREGGGAGLLSHSRDRAEVALSGLC